jgi:predicted CoA-binding protein
MTTPATPYAAAGCHAPWVPCGHAIHSHMNRHRSRGGPSGCGPVTGQRIEDDVAMKRLLKDVRRVAIVGVSPDPARASNDVARYLMRAAPEYSLSFVNPTVDAVLGVSSLASLADTEGIELVCVFRRLEVIGQVADEAITAGATGLWTQLGLYEPGAERAALDAGLDVVMDRCIKVEYARLIDSGRSS